MTTDHRPLHLRMLRTAVIGVGHLGQQHARIHAALSAENKIRLVSVCDLDTRRASEIAERYGLESTTDWQTLIGKVDAVSLAVPTESHAESPATCSDPAFTCWLKSQSPVRWKKLIA